jgi:hypothetical protein
LNQSISGPNCNGKGRASPVITLLLILLHWILYVQFMLQ